MAQHSDTIKQILIAVLELAPDAIVEDTSMITFPAWDSMRQISIITGLENEFGIFIEAGEANELNSYAKLISFIDEHPDI